MATTITNATASEHVRSASEPQGSPATSSSPTESQTLVHSSSTSTNNSRKRAFSGGASTTTTTTTATTTRRRSGKVIKVTRACDACKARKARCSGTLPCESCTRRREDCRYAAAYTRGRPVSPKRVSVCESLSAVTQPESHDERRIQQTRSGIETNDKEEEQQQQQHQQPKKPTEAPSRASPELGVAEIQGQYHDTTSGHAFLYRAFRRLSRQPANEERGDDAPGLRPGRTYYSDESPTLAHGDKPLELDRTAQHHASSLHLPSYEKAMHLSHLYFDVCIATYRFLHRPSVEAWLETLLRNHNAGLPLFRGIGCAKAAIALTVLAIATANDEKRSGRFLQDEATSMARSDSLFAAAGALVQQETASPTLESAQARLIQVLYLLTTSRMNQAWYVFGTTIQLIAALGLHRRRRRPSKRVHQDAATDLNYITSQCRARTLWTAYILDEYLGVLFGRPRHYHEEDIDQDMPDCINDEDMFPSGPSPSSSSPSRARAAAAGKDCTLNALVAHAQLALVLAAASRTVYSIQPSTTHADRLAAARRRCGELRAWRANLPPHLNSSRVRPSSLVPCFRRQSVALTTAYCHAMIHVNRLFILSSHERGQEAQQEAQIRAALGAAGTVLEMVDDMIVEEGLLFHAFWWTQHVAFCALAVVYACEVQCRRGLVKKEVLYGWAGGDDQEGTSEREALLRLADKCEAHLARATASNSPSRRYSLILEVLRKEVNSKDGEEREQQRVVSTAPVVVDGWQPTTMTAGSIPVPYASQTPVAPLENYSLLGAGGLQGVDWSMQEWQSEDWQDLDSMAFGSGMFPDSHEAPFEWDAAGTAENTGILR